MQTQPNDNSMNDALRVLKKNMYRRAFLALFLIVLTVVMLFAVTTAWYANVARTSELMFQVATWGFDGSIWVDENVMVAGPGDDGGIYMTLKNESDSAVSANVRVDKKALSEQMQKRLFFYVDTSAVQNGEVVEKQYLTGRNGYEYTVMGQSNLNLTPTYHNDAEIKWEWVYDMLGYYVYGNLVTNVEYTTLENNAGPINNGITVEIQEYLRPIEYDYDEITTVFSDPVTVHDEQIRFVESINGTPVTTFLANLTSKDGYNGKVDGQTAHTPDGFYPVAIDAATGSGVWLYLCNYAQIEAGIAYDTQQGMAALSNQGEEADDQSMKVTLNVYAEKMDMNTKVVGSGAELATVMQSADVKSVRLAQDMEMSVPVTIPKNKSLMVDLNGKTLIYSGEGNMLTALQGSSVVFTNGTIVGNGTNSGFDVTGSQLVLSQIKASELANFVSVSDQNVQIDSIVRILGCVVDVNTYGVYIRGNGNITGNFSQVIIDEGSHIKAQSVGIFGTRSEGSHGTEISVLGNSYIEGRSAAVYHPQKDSVLTVQDSELTGWTGIVVKGGRVTLISSVINGTGNARVPQIVENGWTDTGDGVYLETAYDYGASVEIFNCIVNAAYGQAVRMYEPTSDFHSLVVHSGKFSSDVSEYVPDTSSIDLDSYEVTVNP